MRVMYGKLNWFVLYSIAVKLLQTISDKVDNLNWKVTEHSCNGDKGFGNANILEDQITRNVTCDCSFNASTVCHVTLM